MPSLLPSYSDSSIIVFPPTPEKRIPITSSRRSPISSSRSSHPSASAISSINTERGIHSDVRLPPPLGRQTDAGGRPDPIRQPNRHSAMTTSGIEPVPTGPDRRINHRDSLLPGDLTQTPRASSPAQGSTRSSWTAVHSHYDRLKPTATIKRYERSVKLEPPFIDVNLPPFTTSFVDG